METLAVTILLYLVLELFEIRWQKAPTMLQMLVRIRREYEKNIFYFFFLHPTYFFAIWLMLETGGNAGAIALLFLKTVDITAKIILMQQVFEKKEISMQLHDMLMTPLEKWMPYLGLAVYPPLVVWAFA